MGGRRKMKQPLGILVVSRDSQGLLCSTPVGTRTRNIPLRRRVLCPVELRARTAYFSIVFVLSSDSIFLKTHPINLTPP